MSNPPTPSSAAKRYAAGVIGHEVSTEEQRLHLLEQMLDPDTIRTLERRGIQPSWRCLELGAGAGSIACWLASRCPDGQVVATDLVSPSLPGSPRRTYGCCGTTWWSRTSRSARLISSTPGGCW